MVGAGADVASVIGAAPQAASPGASGRQHLSQIARGGLFNLAGAALAAILTFVFTVVVTRGVDRAQAGVFFSLTSAFVIVYTVARLGVPTGLVFFISRYRATGSQDRLKAVIRDAFVPVTALAVTLGAAGVVAAPWLALHLVGNRHNGTVLLVRVLACSLVFAALTDLGVGATRGFGVMRPLVIVDRVGRPLAQLVLALIVVGFGVRSALGIGLAWALPFVPSAVILLLWADRLRRKAERRSGLPASVQDETGGNGRAAFWRFTAPRSLGSIAQMALQRSDIVLLGALRGPKEAAIYAAATRFLVLGQLGAGAISTTIQPKLAHLLAKDDREAARTVYRVATVWLILMAWPIYLVSAVFSRQLLHLFGRGYAVGAAVIVILSFTMLVATATGNVDVVLAMAGRPTWTMANAFCALGINLALNFFLIPRYGIFGAAIAWSAALLFNSLTPLTQLALSMRLHPFGRASAQAAVLTATCFGVLPFVGREVTGGSVAAGLMGVTIGAALYLAGLWHWRRSFDLASLTAVRRRGDRSAPA